MKSILVVVLCVLGLGSLRAGQKAPRIYTLQSPPQPDFSGINWLVGDWAGKTVGNGPQGRVTLSVSYILDRRFLVLHEQIALPASKTAPATQEILMGILSASPSGKKFHLNLYSGSGFMTYYRATVKDGEINFSPEGGSLPPPGWLFRRSFARTHTGQLMENVEVAPPKQSFFKYYTAELHAVKPGNNGANDPKIESLESHPR